MFHQIWKMTPIYMLALFTMVACGRSESGVQVRPGTTTNGNANVTRDGNTNVPVATTPDGTQTTLAVLKTPQTTFIGGGYYEYEPTMFSMTIDLVHGQREIYFTLYPTLMPTNQDQSLKTIGTMTYKAQGVCGNSDCTQFAILIDVQDPSNGTDLQFVEYWDTKLNAAKSQKRFTQSAFVNISDAYQALSGISL